MKPNDKNRVIQNCLHLTAIFILIAYVSVYARIKYNFNPGWLVFVGDTIGIESVDYNDSGWQSITLPHAWNENEAFKLDIHDLSTGIAWYRKHFKISKAFCGKKVFIEFEGVRQAGEIFVNGEFVGLHENGVMAFGYDITDKVKFYPAENVIAVRTDNSWDYCERSTGTRYQWHNDNFNANYGGIPKNTWLYIMDKLYQTLPLYSDLGTTGQYIYAENIDIKNRSAEITAETQVKNEYPTSVICQYIVHIEDMNSRRIKTIDGGKRKIAPGETRILRAGASVDSLHFWSWGYGYLYTVTTILQADGEIIDIVKTRTGFRKTAFADGMIKLNDRILLVKGYAQRTSNEWPAVGMSVPPWMSDFSNRMIVSSHGNLVRWMHVTPWKQDVESCDRVGLIQAMPAGDAEKDSQGRQWEQRIELMRDAIIYNRNHPSILFYEAGNKTISEGHMQEMKNIRDQYDPDGGRAIGSREMLDSRIAEYGGEMLYVNKSSTIPMWAMEYMRDEGLRKYWDEYSPPFHEDGEGPLYKGRDASEYNRNQDSFAKECIARWYDFWRERPGTGRFVNSGGVKIIFSDTNTHFRGAENYRRSGVVDALRIPKDAYFTHQVLWNGWLETEKNSSYIIGHWNYAEGVIKNVYVVSTGEKVELFVNNESRGFGERDYHFLHTFKDVEWEAGTLKAVSYDASNRVLCQTEKRTSGRPEGIKLTLHTHPEGFRADGADLALVDVEVVDADGCRCPTSNAMIDFELNGPAEWRGGIAKGSDNYILSKSLPVECGINRVILRSVPEEGQISLTARSDGLKCGVMKLESHSVKMTEGLSLDIPDTGLPSFLEYGPTPDTQEIKTTRRSVKIVNAIAGSNQNDAIFSYDGNQVTRWTNAGDCSKAWIMYEFEKETRINQIAIKLSGWRTRRYPVVVKAGDKAVFTGLTKRNLGYFYILFEPLKADHISIRLLGEREYKEMFDFNEITSHLDKETQSDQQVRNVEKLNIVDVEVFFKQDQ
ncbi:DUF4982 domain-containing protein [bacterium]|nr:DUF4982 domain-containing protein [bacterium]